MRVEVIKGFLSAEDCKLLSDWCNLGVERGWVSSGITAGAMTKMRLTSRLYADKFVNPPEILAIAKRVREFCGVDGYPIIDGHGRDGIVVSYTRPGGDVYPHVDPRADDGTPTLRCNIMTQGGDSGGQLYIDGEAFDVGVGDLHCYLVSEHKHWVESVAGNTPRIMWMFGAHVPADDWNSGKIQLGQHR